MIFITKSVRKGLLILLTCLTTSAFPQDYAYRPKYSTIIDSNKGAQLLQQCSRESPKNVTNLWTPSENDIATLETQFKEVTGIKARACCFPNGTIRTLDNFGFQYIGVTIKRKKYIYLNAFYFNDDDDFKTMYKNWKADPIVMCDGGDHYWGVLFDLKKMKFKRLAINGMI